MGRKLHEITIPHLDLNWRAYSDLSYLLKGERPREGVITVEDVYRLRDTTNVGDIVTFRAVVYRRLEGYGGQTKPETIIGRVKAKYPHIFMLEDGRTFSWKDYLLGRQNE